MPAGVSSVVLKVCVLGAHAAGYSSPVVQHGLVYVEFHELSLGFISLDVIFAFHVQSGFLGFFSVLFGV